MRLRNDKIVDFIQDEIRSYGGWFYNCRPIWNQAWADSKMLTVEADGKEYGVFGNLKRKSQDEDFPARVWREEKERRDAKVLTLRFVDELTGETRTFDIPDYFTCRNLIDHVQDLGFIAHSPFSNVFYTIRELQEYRPYMAIKETTLCSGDTLHIMMKDTALLGRNARERFYREYGITVYWRETKSRFLDKAPSCEIFIDRIQCHGFDTKNGLEKMLEFNHRENGMVTNFTILPSCWPKYYTRKNGKQILIKYLCQLSKEQQVVLYAEAAWETEIMSD